MTFLEITAVCWGFASWVAVCYGMLKAGVAVGRAEARAEAKETP